MEFQSTTSLITQYLTFSSSRPSQLAIINFSLFHLLMISLIFLPLLYSFIVVLSWNLTSFITFPHLLIAFTFLRSTYLFFQVIPLMFLLHFLTLIVGLSFLTWIDLTTMPFLGTLHLFYPAVSLNLALVISRFLLRLFPQSGVLGKVNGL